MPLDKEPMRTDFGFLCRYTHTIMDGAVLRWTRDLTLSDLEISASRNGVCISGCAGPMDWDGCKRMGQLLILADYISRQLARRIEVADLMFGPSISGRTLEWIDRPTEAGIWAEAHRESGEIEIGRFTDRDVISLPLSGGWLYFGPLPEFPKGETPDAR